MTTYTLAGLKAEIADDTLRSDLSTQIANAISSAIRFYQKRRFYFNETRTTTFATVASQATYSSSDDTDIPKFMVVDAVFITDSSGNRYELDYYDPADIHWLQGNGASTGRPFGYSYYDQSFTFYPIPDDVYTITPMGQISKDEPASDGEANNVWMTEAYELIRCRAKGLLFTHVMKDPAQAQTMSLAEQVALADLVSRTNAKLATGFIARTSF